MHLRINTVGYWRGDVRQSLVFTKKTKHCKRKKSTQRDQSQRTAAEEILMTTSENRRGWRGKGVADETEVQMWRQEITPVPWFTKALRVYKRLQTWYHTQNKRTCWPTKDCVCQMRGTERAVDLDPLPLINYAISGVSSQVCKMPGEDATDNLRFTIPNILSLFLNILHLKSRYYWHGFCTNGRCLSWGLWDWWLFFVWFKFIFNELFEGHHCHQNSSERPPPPVHSPLSIPTALLWSCLDRELTLAWTPSFSAPQPPLFADF